MEVQIDLKLYAVQSKDGKWLRAKGYSGSGNSWVENIEDAKIYPKLGNARRQVTWWSNHFSDFGIPHVIEFSITKGLIIDETERVKKSMEKKTILSVQNGPLPMEVFPFLIPSLLEQEVIMNMI